MLSLTAEDGEIEVQSAATSNSLNLPSDSVSWSTTEAAKQLKGKRDFRRYIMRVVLSLIQKHSSLKQTDSRSSSNFVEFLQCGRILYEQCVSKIQQIADYDLISTAIALECFYELLKILLARYQTNVTKYLADIGVNALGGVNGQLKRLIEDYKKLLEYSVESEEDHMDGEFEPTIRKITQIVVSTLALLPLHLSEGHLEPVYVWCKTYAEKKHMLNEVAAKSFVSLLLQLNRRCKARGQLIESMAKLLCRDIGQLDPDVSLTKVVEYKIVSQKLRMPLFSLLCSAINTNLNEIFWMVNWLRSEHTSQVKSGVTIIDNTDHWEELRSKEQELCLYLSHTIRELAMVSGVSVPVGPAVDTVLNTVAHLYNLLSSVVKYFIMRSSKDNPVFKLVKLESVFFVTSTIMAPRLNDLISLVTTKLKVLLECTKNRDFKITADQVKNKTLSRFTARALYSKSTANDLNGTFCKGGL
uniref:(California timema) hypothetical protein n=1 Tax=Timema californicum TaxID=61474 RepID=A0A7R9J7X0_TIMCA|nr:unnamed protein product [Timema californicum]